jgi:sugar lactone lactonase YvrE
VKHLAAGMLGDNSPPPFSPGLKQKLTWDGTDDAGRPAAGGPYRFRVRLGMKARLHRTYGWNGHWLADLNGMVCDRDGMLYVVHSGMWLPHRRTWLISAFGRNGQYHHQAFPGPAGLPPEKRTGWPWIERPDGVEVPMIHHAMTRAFHPVAVFHKRVFPVATSDGRLIMLTGSPEGLRVSGLDVRGGRRLVTIGLDGSVSSGYLGPIVAPVSYGGFGHIALTPDERHVYVSGLHLRPNRGQSVEHGKNGFCHVVWKVPLSGSAGPSIFAGKLFTPLGGEEGLNEPQGLDVDRRGNLYVADYGNNRVAVFRPDGSLLDEIPIDQPDLVRVSRKTGNVFVTRIRKRGRALTDEHWYTKSHNWKLLDVVRFSALPQMRRETVLKVAEGDRGHGSGSFLAVDDSGDRPVLYVGGVDGLYNSSVYRVAETDGVMKIGPRVAGYSVWSIERDGNVGFTGDVVYGRGRLISAGPSNWGFKTNHWNVHDPETGEFMGYWSVLDERGKVSSRSPLAGDLVAGRDGNLYGRHWQNRLFRFDASGRPLPFRSTGKAVLNIPHPHGRQAGLFIDAGGKIYVPTIDQESEQYAVLVVNPDGTLDDQPVVVAQGAKLSGIAVDSEGSIYLGAHVYPEGRAVPDWVAKQQQVGLSLRESASFRGAKDDDPGLRIPSHAYAQTATLLKFIPTGGGIVADEAGRYTAYLYHRPAKVSLRGAAWGRRVGFTPHKGTGCFCETMRIATDSYDRLFVPDVSTFSVYVLDTAGNVLTQFGEYGNMDSCRSYPPAGLPPQPEIGFAWPLAVACGGEMAFVADHVNCRLVGVKFEYATVAECEAD